MLTLTVGVLVVLAVPLLGIHIGQRGVATFPNDLPSKQGYLAGSTTSPIRVRIRSKLWLMVAMPAPGWTCRSSKQSSPTTHGLGPAPLLHLRTPSSWP